jgi:hypothetical protein
MPDRIKAEALRDTAIIEVMPHDGDLPEGKMSCLDPSAAGLYRMTPIRSFMPQLSRANSYA